MGELLKGKLGQVNFFLKKTGIVKYGLWAC